MACLPWEMTAEILCRLPVKDLFRYRCVAKLWRSLIDGQDFMKKHLNHSLETNSNHGLILRNRSHQDFSWVDLDKLDCAAVKIPNPVTKIGKRTTQVLGSCNGLLALKMGHYEFVIVLFNPSTRRFWKVEPPSFTENPATIVLYGFGHDPVHDDYKLVRISASMGFENETRVYSAKSNTWRKISQLFPCYFFSYRGTNLGLLSNNALHWLALRKPIDGICGKLKSSDIIIASFDIVTEEYHEVPPPTSVNIGSDWVSLYLDEIDGSLCTILNHDTRTQPADRRVDVWVMKEYGIQESWTKLCVINHVNNVFPIVSLKKDKVLLNDYSGNLISYDLERRVTSDVSISAAPLGFNEKLCVESLVRLDNDADDGMLNWK